MRITVKLGYAGAVKIMSNDKTIETITLGTQSIVFIDNCRLLYEDPDGEFPMNCEFHEETQMFLTKDNKIDCLVCEREYAEAKKKGLI